MKSKFASNGAPPLLVARKRSPEPSNDEFMKQLVEALGAIRDGDFSVKLPSEWTGLEGKVVDHMNAITTRLWRSSEGIFRLRREVGEEGKIGERLPLGDAVGAWAERVEAINSLLDELSQPTVEVGRVIGAVAKGDLSQAMPLELNGRPLQGEYLRTAKLVNGMVGQLEAFSVEVTRVAREVGTEGKLGGQAQVTGVVGRLEGPHRLGQPDGRQTSPRRSATSPTSPSRSPTATSRRRSRSTSRARSCS